MKAAISSRCSRIDADLIFNMNTSADIVWTHSSKASIYTPICLSASTRATSARPSSIKSPAACVRSADVVAKSTQAFSMPPLSSAPESELNIVARSARSGTASPSPVPMSRHACSKRENVAPSDAAWDSNSSASARAPAGISGSTDGGAGSSSLSASMQDLDGTDEKGRDFLGCAERNRLPRHAGGHGGLFVWRDGDGDDADSLRF